MIKIYLQAWLASVLLLMASSATMAAPQNTPVNAGFDSTMQQTQDSWGLGPYQLEPDIRDPFSPSELMFETAQTRAKMTAGKGSYAFSQTLGPSENVPKMRLKGFINNGDGPLALLDVGSARTYLVRVGDEINIDPSIPNSVIKIVAISRQTVTVETGTVAGAIRVRR